MNDQDDAAYFRQRERQELDASDRSPSPEISRLHRKMARQYADKAKEMELPR